jgi:hypothetical protein
VVVGIDTLVLFFSAGTQYYIAGRYAVLARLSPVAGNLLHHAIEMYLKGYLSKAMTLGQLEGLSHNLPKIWSEFKVQAADPGLYDFNALIASLDNFEELRYPDSILAKGMGVIVGVIRSPGAEAKVAADPPVPTYEVYLQEIDALVDRIFRVASVNPAFLLSGLSAGAREYLKDGNAQGWAG